jgi:internalin A
VDHLCEDAAQRGIAVLRDTNEVKLGGRLTRFMQKLATHDRVFVILSKKYLESPFCMYELLEVWRQCKNEQDEFSKRVRVYVLPETPVWTPAERMKCAVYWRKEYLELEGMVNEHGADLLGEADFQRFKLMQDFYHRVGDILALVADTLQPKTIEELESYSFD